MTNEKKFAGFELCANGAPCIGAKYLSCPFSPRNAQEPNCGVSMAKSIIALLEEGGIEMKLREALDKLRDIGMSKKLLEEAVEEAGLENVVISHALAEDLIEKLDVLRDLWESRELK